MNNGLIKCLEKEFKLKANPNVAIGQAAYMKGHFEYYGLTSPIRREITKPFLLNNNLPPKSEIEKLTKELWQKPQREFHYFAMELNQKYFRTTEKKDIQLFTWMAKHNSWWDSIDVIAPKLMGNYFKVFPEERMKHIDIWLNSGDRWLIRCAILFQLKYKQDLATDLLGAIIQSQEGSKEFFINKAIGWVLREYSRTNAQWVLQFADNNNLSNLSRREGLRLIVKK